jgi:hypothetical protein
VRREGIDSLSAEERARFEPARARVQRMNATIPPRVIEAVRSGLKELERRDVDRAGRCGQVRSRPRTRGGARRARGSSTSRRSRSPGSSRADDDPPCDLAVVPLAVFRANGARWRAGGAV